VPKIRILKTKICFPQVRDLARPVPPATRLCQPSWSIFASQSVLSYFNLVSYCFQTPLNFNSFVMFCCERHGKRLVFIVNYDINFFCCLFQNGCFLYMKVISCVLSVLAIPTSCFIVKNSPMRKAQSCIP
jgi:hypothetical protein